MTLPPSIPVPSSDEVRTRALPIVEKRTGEAGSVVYRFQDAVARAHFGEHERFVLVNRRP